MVYLHLYDVDSEVTCYR